MAAQSSGWTPRN